MPQNYKIFKNDTAVEITNQYFQECIEKVQAQIVIKTRYKYARIEYDLYTLNNASRSYNDLSRCKIADNIREYAQDYAKSKHLPKEMAAKTIQDGSGGFEFFIEDLEMVGDDICKIIDDAVESGCIEYKTIDDFDDELVAEVRRIYENP